MMDTPLPVSKKDSALQKALATVSEIRSEGFRFVVIMGMAKTGTTLPLTLLDGHPQLTVFPEELRFFHNRADAPDGRAAADRLLRNGNTQMLSVGKTYFDPSDYSAHKGTGFGHRDYSGFDFALFEHLVREGFAELPDTCDRLLLVMVSFRIAAGLPPRLASTNIFACKAPHNELFGRKWSAALGHSGRYIICTRLSSEHFLSQRNVARFQDARVDSFAFAHTVRDRYQMWHEFPKGQTFVLDYDTLLNGKDGVLTDLAAFLQITRTPSLNTPTKMGIPWSGNSSRGIITEGIFRNEHRAKNLLTPMELYTIQTVAAPLYHRLGWERDTQLGTSDKLRWYLSLGLYRLRTGLRAFARFGRRAAGRLSRRLGITAPAR
jgi:hypothetical protein